MDISTLEPRMNENFLLQDTLQWNDSEINVAAAAMTAHADDLYSSSYDYRNLSTDRGDDLSMSEIDLKSSLSSESTIEDSPLTTQSLLSDDEDEQAFHKRPGTDDGHEYLHDVPSAAVDTPTHASNPLAESNNSCTTSDRLILVYLDRLREAQERLTLETTNIFHALSDTHARPEGLKAEDKVGTFDTEEIAPNATRTTDEASAGSQVEAPSQFGSSTATNEGTIEECFITEMEYMSFTTRLLTWLSVFILSVQFVFAFCESFNSGSYWWNAAYDWCSSYPTCNSRLHAVEDRWSSISLTLFELGESICTTAHRLMPAFGHCALLSIFVMVVICSIRMRFLLAASFLCYYYLRHTDVWFMVLPYISA